MEMKIFLAVVFQLFSFALSQRDEVAAFLKDYNTNFPKFVNEKYKAMFIQATNITAYNTKKLAEASDKFRERVNKIKTKARIFNLSDSDDDTKRQFKFLLTTKTPSDLATAQKVEALAVKMKNIYSQASIPYNSQFIKTLPMKNENRNLDLGKLIFIMGKSNDTGELLYVWKTWRKSLSSQLKSLYETYVRLNNIGAVENGFMDAGEYYRSFYEVDDLKGMVDNFLKDMQPFYTELHGYVRYRLSLLYPDIVDVNGPIPAHLVGNIWAQDWAGLYDRIIPYPNEPSLDVTPILNEKHTISGMLRMAEDFYTSIGWQNLPKTFWENSLFIKPRGRQVSCYPSALDLMVKEKGVPDVRIKMCMQKTQRDFITIHHELGHIYYYLLYWNQDFQYRGGANPGFHEAVGDFITLSMQTPAHLNAVGLLEDISQSKEADINFLMKTAFETVSFLPFAFVMDKWMWEVYSGDIKPDDYNKKWWEYREKYQGIKSPVKGKTEDFDPAAKFHISGDVPYIRYFFASILQFVFHKQACQLAKNTEPLHQCSIYKSKAAGKAFGDMLALGKSKHWREALKQFTGSEDITSEAIRQYFKPLIDWLKEYRKKNKYKIGWGLNNGNNASRRMKISNATFFICITVLFVFTV